MNRFLRTAMTVCLAVIVMLLFVPSEAKAATVEANGENLVSGSGTMDGILAEGETEKILNNDWTQSYPVATFGGPGGDSPAKVQNVDGNHVLVLGKSPDSGDFASFFADLWADGNQLPAGTYLLGMDLKPVGDFTTDNVGFNLYSQYNDVRIYDQGWKNCTELENGWLHYEQKFEIAAYSVDSIQMWLNTMGSSTLYVDNLSFCMIAAPEAPAKPAPADPSPEEPTPGEPAPDTGTPDLSENLVANNGTMDGILTEGETEKTLTSDWMQSYPVATFGGSGGDSPAKVQNVDDNNVLVLEKSPGSGDFASFFADLSYADNGAVSAGLYLLSMDLKPVGDDFATDNVGYNLYGQYSDIRIYDQGWQNCTQGEDGWLHYEKEFDIAADSVDSIQMWFNTMGSSTLYVDNLSFREIIGVETPDVAAIEEPAAEEPAPEEPAPEAPATEGSAS